MPARPLKKFDIVDPAGRGPPENDSNFMHARVRPFCPPAPLSTFASDEPAGKDRLRQRIVAYCVAALLEAATLAVIWVALDSQPDLRQTDENAAVEMVQAPPEPQPTPPKLQKIELPPIKPEQVRTLPRMRLVVDRMLPIPAPQAAPPISQPPSPPPPPTPAPSSEAADRFQAQVRAAIQAAIIYPATARMMKQQGQAKVAFVLDHGHAAAPHIVQSSGNATIDAAAVAAVRDAVYPTPPPDMAGKPLSFAVFVVFSLTSR